jgi:hypothetical protein
MLNDKHKETVRSVLQSHLDSDVSRNLIDCIRSVNRTLDNNRRLARFLDDVLCKLLRDVEGILFLNSTMNSALERSHPVTTPLSLLRNWV